MMRPLRLLTFLLRRVFPVCVLLFSCSMSACSLAPARLKRGTEVRAAGEAVETSSGWKKCFDLVETRPDSPEGRHALMRLIEAGRSRLASHPGMRPVDLAPGLRVTFRPGSATTFAYDYFEELIPAADTRVAGLTNHRRDGTGLPLIGRRANTGREPIEAYYPPEAITRPVTAVAGAGQGEGGSRILTITLYCPLCHETVQIHGKQKPLAAEITAPWAALLERAGRLRATGLTGFLKSHIARKPQLYLMEPYDPRREPLLLVHGLLSTPLAWASLTNELWADPAIRRRYQIWHYHYPTSAPFLYSASVFRRQIAEVRRMLKVQTHREVRPLTILAHSMGGLITRTLISSSGTKIWNTVMVVPPGRLQASAEDIATTQRILEWKADRQVKRVVFICVPHRGSPFSQSVAGRIGTALARPPEEFASLCARVIRRNPGTVAAAFRKTLGRGKLTSVHTLSPAHPVLAAMNSLPTAPWVAVHSIIGDRGRHGPLETSSDGFVPYTSSHWPGAVSEKIVPSNHSAPRHPAAIAEIIRILKLK